VPNLLRPQYLAASLHLLQSAWTCPRSNAVKNGFYKPLAKPRAAESADKGEQI
jgi:hypothetical protein